MKYLTIAVLGLALNSTLAMAEDCVAPTPPAIPEGEESSLEQMLNGQKAVKAFQEANLAYMSCLEPKLTAAEEAAKAGTEGAAENYLKLQETYNNAVSKEEEVAGKFNSEIRDYKTANPS
jgi:hypothetical protein